MPQRRQPRRGYRFMPDADPRHVYHDVLFALDAHRGSHQQRRAVAVGRYVARSQRNLAAARSDVAAPSGCGTGYYSAVDGGAGRSAVRTGHRRRSTMPATWRATRRRGARRRGRRLRAVHGDGCAVSTAGPAGCDPWSAPVPRILCRLARCSAARRPTGLPADLAAARRLHAEGDARRVQPTGLAPSCCAALGSFRSSGHAMRTLDEAPGRADRGGPCRSGPLAAAQPPRAGWKLLAARRRVLPVLARDRS